MNNIYVNDLSISAEEHERLYDLLEFEWNSEIVRARPINWENDKISQYEMTCPLCGNLIIFGTLDKNIVCEGCNGITENPSFIFYMKKEPITLDVEYEDEYKEEYVDINEFIDNPLDGIDIDDSFNDDDINYLVNSIMDE